MSCYNCGKDLNRANKYKILYVRDIDCYVDEYGEIFETKIRCCPTCPAPTCRSCGFDLGLVQGSYDQPDYVNTNTVRFFNRKDGTYGDPENPRWQYECSMCLNEWCTLWIPWYNLKLTLIHLTLINLHHVTKRRISDSKIIDLVSFVILNIYAKAYTILTNDLQKIPTTT